MTDPISNTSRTALTAQLARDQVKHSDWVACPSGKTPQGKAIIASLETDMRSITQQLKQLPATDAASPASSTSSGPGQLVDVYV